MTDYKMPLPIDAELRLGSIARATTGRVHFALRIKAPDNVNLMLDDVVRFLTGKLPAQRPGPYAPPAQAVAAAREAAR